MSAPVIDKAPDRHYGDRVVAVEPGGAERIPLAERHGTPIQLLWTWTSPNMEFATIFVGILAMYLGLTFWQAVGTIVLGSALGSATHAVLSSWGPETGFCQMVLSRRAFGYRGNILPAGLNSLAAGIGWFAVNSVSGALALASLTSINKFVCLAIVVAIMLALAFFGHNLIQLFERYAFPVLAVLFVIGAIVILTKTKPGMAATADPGAFWIILGATFGYACGWNPYASDYTRYLKPGSGRAAGMFAAIGMVFSCSVLEIVGAAAFTAIGGKNWNFDNPVVSYTSLMPTWLGKLTLLAICLGAIAANALNIYSSALSFTAMGLKLPTASARALVSVVMGLAGFIVAIIAIDRITSYEGFLLVIAYWIGPWLAVVFADRWLHKTTDDRVYTSSHFQNLAGPIAMLVGVVVSIWLFANQPGTYVGLLPKHIAGLGDLTFEVGFVLSFALYAALFKPLIGRQSAAFLAETGQRGPGVKAGRAR